ncbi:MAG: hypothetical protein WCH04_10095 [Gammaproteobacteria bacterium]
MNWQMVRLFEPPQNELKREAKGRVMIYDGLTEKDVERALDEQFDRLVYMMFIRVVVTESDDGCN